MLFPLRIHPAFFALAVVISIHTAHAQDPPRYAEYREDSTFRMGGHGVIPRKAASDLRLDYIYYRPGPTCAQEGRTHPFDISRAGLR